MEISARKLVISSVHCPHCPVCFMEGHWN